MAEKDYKEAAKVAAFKKRQGDHVHYQPLSVRAAKRQRAVARAHNGKPMRFVSLHHHSTYSFLDGFQLPEAHVRRATEINMQAIAMTEHGNIFSHVKLEKAAQAAGVKPIFGCEVYMGWTDDERKAQKKNHLTVLAKDEMGYRNLLQLVSRSWAEGFYHEPTVDPYWLVEHQKGLVVLSGCQGSALFTALVGGKHVAEEDASYERGLQVAAWFASRLDDYYVEVQAFPELTRTCDANPLLAQVAADVGVPLVATMDVHYTAPEEVEIQKILHNVRPGNKQTLEDQVRDWGYQAPLCLPPTDRSIYRRLRETGLTENQATEAIVSTEEIAQECNVVLPKLPVVHYPLPRGYDTEQDLWRAWLREGWFYRGIDKLAQAGVERYRAQLHHEMELIESKDFVGYFLIVADGVRYAKDQQIPVGPARGSAAASLCCYLLRITEVDPLRFPELQFERFLDPTREDMPDIDLDFAPSGIPLLREYYGRKYGDDCVGSVGTFGMYKSRAALDDVARVFKVPKHEVEKIKGLLIERSSGDLRASATIQDTMEQFEQVQEVVDTYPDLKYAMDLEGNAKSFGVHAAGLVVSNGPITDVCALLERTVDGHLRQVVSMDKYDAKRQGLEKLDFLSLATMEQIYDVLQQVGASVEDLYDIPLDDADTAQGFVDNDVVGIFQFDGRSMRFLNSMLKADTFREVAHAVTLVRPGPMLSGAAQHYIAVKNGAEHEHVHPALEAITSTTNYQVIFQEQVLRIVREIGGFDYTHRARIRKVMSAKRGEQEFNREWHRFRDGAAKLHDMDADTAMEIWNIITTAGAYVFNAAHSYAYGMLGWWCMYLKRHYPAQFYSAGLAKLPKGDDGVRHDSLRRDAVAKGLALLPPDRHSGTSWRARDKHTLVAGWEQIPGIGEVLAERISDYLVTCKGKRKVDLSQVPGVGPKTVATIQEFQHSSDPFGVEAVERALAAARAAVDEAGLPAPTHTAAEALAAPIGRQVVLGIPTHRNLRELFEVHRARTGEELDPATVKDPDNTEWVLMPVRDSSDSIQVIFSRRNYRHFKKAIWDIRLNKDVVLVEGSKVGGGNKDKGWGSNSGVFIVSKLWVIDVSEDVNGSA